MNETKKILSEVIDSANLDDALKKVLRKSLFEIFEHESKILSEIKSEVRQEIKSARRGKNFLIATALVPREKISAMSEKNFYIIKEDGKSEESFSVYFPKQGEFESSEINSGPYFLCCPYDEVDNFCRRQYTGKSSKGSFRYELTTQTRFIEQEKKFFRLAELYKFELPIIFSPYARRAVDIKVLDTENFEFSTCDFEFEKNFGNKLKHNHVLMWNIDSPGKKNCSSFLMPTEEENFCHYIFDSGIDKNAFILPPHTFAATIEKVEKIDDKRIDFVTSEEWSDDSGEFLKIFPVDIDENFPIEEIFFNRFNGGELFDKLRLRTAGDINYVLKKFSNDKFSADFLGMTDEPEEIKKYQKSRGHAYYMPKGEKFIRASAKLPKCMIKFSAPKIYLIDYANFVLHFLGMKYPEYFWAGVK